MQIATIVVHLILVVSKKLPFTLVISEIHPRMLKTEGMYTSSLPANPKNKEPTLFLWVNGWSRANHNFFCHI